VFRNYLIIKMATKFPSMYITEDLFSKTAQKWQDKENKRIKREYEHNKDWIFDTAVLTRYVEELEESQSRTERLREEYIDRFWNKNNLVELFEDFGRKLTSNYYKNNGPIKMK
jgi:hypothetical protein